MNSSSPPLSILAYPYRRLQPVQGDRREFKERLKRPGSALIWDFESEVRNEDYQPGEGGYGIPHPGILFIGADGVVELKFAVPGYRKRPPFEAIPLPWVFRSRLSVDLNVRRRRRHRCFRLGQHMWRQAHTD